MGDDDYWAPTFQLMLEEARRSIDRQSERVQNVRERAVGLVGFGSVVAAALGFGGDKDLGAAGAVGVAAFVVVAATALFVLYPREFHFELGARRIEDWMYLPKNRGINHVVFSTAISHDENHSYNHQKLRRMQAAIALGVLALSVETVALVVRLVL
jgi:hypothetical protein